jgi:hypothetical protein
MDHREPPRLGPGDHLFDMSIEQPSKGSRLRPLIGARHHRQIDLMKVGVVLLSGLAAAIVLLILGSWAARSAHDWLAVQPPYQIPFKEIHLVNPPPPWFLGGNSALLDSVRKSTFEPEIISVLQVSSEQLANSFKKYPWIESAEVFYRPGQIDVDLRYHQPVAWVQLSAADQVVIDEKGNILPIGDINVPRLGPIKIKVRGTGLTPPSDRQPGVIWKIRDASGLERTDERIVAAARMASFLSQEPQKSDALRTNALRITEINVSYFSSRGLFLFNDEETALLWGEAPGDESPGKPSAAEKWAMVRRWYEKERARFLVEGDYWTFSNDRLSHVCAHPGARHEPLLKPHEKPTKRPK